MARNKIVYGNETLIDLSGDTVQESDVAQGKTFHKADGSQATGTATGGGTAITPSDSSPVPLAKDSSYTIENNGGYAVTFDESTVSENDVIKNKKYVDNNGVHTGTRPKFYKYNASSKLRLSINKGHIPGNDLPYEGILLKSSNNGYGINRNVGIRITTSRIVQLFTLMDDGITESSINLRTLSANYVDAFQVFDIYIISTNRFFIVYENDTSATNRSGAIRLICIKHDGSLVQSSEQAYPGSYDPNVNEKYTTIFKTLSEENKTYWFGLFNFAKNKDSFSVSLAIGDIRNDTAFSGRRNDSSALSGTTAQNFTNATVKSIAYYTLLNNIKFNKGGYCYIDSSNRTRLMLFPISRTTQVDYAITSTNCSNPEYFTPYFNDINSCAVVNILGLASNGQLVTTMREVNNNEFTVYIDIWEYDAVTPYFDSKIRHVVELPIFGSTTSISDIVCFLHNDIIYIVNINDSGKYVQPFQINISSGNGITLTPLDFSLTCEGLIESLPMEESICSFESDTFAGFCIYGD